MLLSAHYTAGGRYEKTSKTPQIQDKGQDKIGARQIRGSAVLKSKNTVRFLNADRGSKKSRRERPRRLLSPPTQLRWVPRSLSPTRPIRKSLPRNRSNHSIREGHMKRPPELRERPF
jgi:hypothetical protein